MIKFNKSYTSLIAVVLVVTLIYSIALTGFVGVAPVNAEGNDDPNACNLNLSDLQIVSSGPFYPGDLVDLSCKIEMKNGNLGQSHFFLGEGDKHSYVQRVDLGTTSSLAAKEIQTFSGKLLIPSDIDFKGLETATITLPLFAYGFEDRDSQQVAASSKPVDLSITVTKPFEPAPALTIAKVAKNAAGDVITSSVVGQPITYEYTVTNTGNVDLTYINVVDDKKTGQIDIDGGLAKGAAPITVSWTTTPCETGPLTNNAHAHANYDGTTVTSNDATCTVNIVAAAQPGLTLNKIAKPENEDRNWAVPGETIYYSYEIKNTGNVDLTVVLNDDKKAGGLVWTGRVAAGQTETPTWSYLVLPADAGTAITNLATLTCSEIKEPITDTRTVYGVSVPSASINIDKYAAAPYLMVPGSIAYTYVITNTGDLPLTITTLTDDKIADAATQTGALGITLANKGDSVSRTVNSPSITEGTTDWTIAQSITNQVKVAASWTYTIASELGRLVGGNLTRSNTVDDTAEATVQLYKPAISVTKTTTDADTEYKAGDTINYQYVVKNEGNITLTNITLSDDKLGDIVTSEDGKSLAAGESFTVTKTFNVTSETTLGALTNTATVVGNYILGETPTYPNGQPASVTDQDSKTVTIKDDSKPVTYTPGIKVKKSADLSVAYPGDTITYTYKVTNIGDTSLTGITVTDDKLGDIVTSEDGKSLAAGESFTVTKTFNVTSETARGTLINEATVNALYNKEPITPAKDTASVEISRHRSGGGGGITTSTPQPIVVPTEPPVVAPVQPAPVVEPAPEPIVVPAEPKAALPVTGGNTLAYVLIGAALCGLGILAMRRKEA